MLKQFPKFRVAWTAPWTFDDAISPSLSARWWLAIDGNFCYVIGGLGMKVFDISDPTNPTPISPHINTGVCNAEAGGFVTVDEGIAYVTGGLGFVMFNVMNPTNPVKCGSTIMTGVLQHQSQGGPRGLRGAPAGAVARALLGRAQGGARRG